MVTGRVPFEAKTPSEVMRKHLKESITPPDHINTSLSTGISEVIEVMMAKKQEERYNCMAELLADLKAVNEGEPPIRAREKFSLDGLGELENGMAVDYEDEDENVYGEDVITRYRVGLVLMAALAGMLTLVIIFMAVGGKN